MTVVLFGILASIAYPALRPERSQVDAAMETVGSTLLRAQRLAVTRQHDVAVTFRTGQGTVVLHEDADNDGLRDPSERLVARPLTDGAVFGQGGAPDHAVGGGPVTFGIDRNGGPTVVFHRSGSASEEGGVYVAPAGNRDPATRAALLVVDRPTGRTSRFSFVAGSWKLQN